MIKLRKELISVPDQIQLKQQQEEQSRAAEDGKAWLFLCWCLLI